MIRGKGLLIRDQQLKVLQKRLLPAWIQNFVNLCYLSRKKFKAQKNNFINQFYCCPNFFSHRFDSNFQK